MNIAHLSSKLALAAYALAGTGTIQERIVTAWEEAFARLTKKDIPVDLVPLYQEIDAEFKRINKLPDSPGLPQALLQLSDEQAVAVAETIILLSLECAKVRGMIYTQK
ncbi:MAG TPA: hypothetical protein VGB77_03700 [Abditibacteriaceae bacterium]|jgi:hypothetical protein